MVMTENQWNPVILAKEQIDDEDIDLIYRFRTKNMNTRYKNTTEIALGIV